MSGLDLNSDGALFDASLYRDEGLPRTLRERFTIPPLSILDQRQGYWQDRKRAWLGLGIRSEVGREGGLTLSGKQAQVSDYYYQKRDAEARVGRSLSAQEFERDYLRSPEHGLSATGTSVFDPVLCEIAYRWFAPEGGVVLDPFAGGSVRGVVAAALGLSYTGVDLSARQMAANDEQWDEIGPVLGAVPTPSWIAGDSRGLEALLPPDLRADLVFSCPPYADLEVYSDDPADLSTMSYEEFLEAYREIIRLAVARLRDDRFAVWVVGEVRSKTGMRPYRGFVPDTVRAFEDAGAAYYNEAILVSPLGSVPVRLSRQFAPTRKLGKAHQQVLVFAKGDAAKAAAACASFAETATGAGDDRPERSA